MSEEGRPPKRQLSIRYDFEWDVLTVHNIRYAGELFRRIHLAPVGSLFELVVREDGVLTLRSLGAPERDAKADAQPSLAAEALGTDGGPAITLTIEPNGKLPDPDA